MLRKAAWTKQENDRGKNWATSIAGLLFSAHYTLHRIVYMKAGLGQTSNVPSVKLNKCLIANLLAPLLTCVYPQVNLEVMRGAEGFATVGAVLG